MRNEPLSQRDLDVVVVVFFLVVIAAAAPAAAAQRPRFPWEDGIHAPVHMTSRESRVSYQTHFL
jgi:hypothetical protein